MNRPKEPVKTGYAYYYDKQKALVKHLVKLQFIVLLITTFAGLILGCSLQKMGSVIIGALCAIIPNIYYAYYSFRYIGAINARKILNSIYFAETLKFTLVFCLLSISYSITYIDQLGVLIGFIVMFISILFLPFINAKNNNKQKSKI